ncbi:MAG: hypothetical protein ACYCPQ_10085 [Elusimicrobiota bacterium]
MKKASNRVKTAALAIFIMALGRMDVSRAQTGFTFYGPIGRIITPNGGGKNDYAFFCFLNPADSAVSGKIYSLMGNQIAEMSGPDSSSGTGCPQPGGINPQYLFWDGTMNGIFVTSGVYLYEITAEGRSYTGTIVVAR